jgi:hypothetical protein
MMATSCGDVIPKTLPRVEVQRALKNGLESGGQAVASCPDRKT